MSEEGPYSEHYKETVREIRTAVVNWASQHDWRSEEEISHKIKAATAVNAVEIETVDVFAPDEMGWVFELHGIMRFTENEDGGLSYGDAVHFFVKGDLIYDSGVNDWNIGNVHINSANKESDLLSSIGTSLESAQQHGAEDPVTFTFPERKFRSASKLLSYISMLSTDLWYRGHADEMWKLETGIAREKGHSPALESKLRLAFENQTTFLDPASHPLGVAKCTFLMQHHGLPTRLLDWSISPLTALYFAVCDEQKDGLDACIWAMDPAQLNRQQKDAPFPYELDEKQDVIFTEEQENKALAIHAPYTNLRMNMQKAEFTLHSDYRPFEDLRGAEVCLKEKIIISGQIKAEVRKRLTALGVTRAALFPDLDNIAKTIKDDILEKNGPADSEGGRDQTRNSNGT